MLSGDRLVQYMSANKDHQPEEPGRGYRSNPTLGPLGEINLGSDYGFRTTPSSTSPRGKQPVAATPYAATEPATRTPIPAFSADPIIFVRRSAMVSQQGIASTALVAAFLAAAPATVHLTIKGYSDIVGEGAQNLVLSQQRADAVLAVLLSQDVVEAQLTAEGHGATNQFAALQSNGQDNSAYETLRANRRVDMELAIDLD